MVTVRARVDAFLPRRLLSIDPHMVIGDGRPLRIDRRWREWPIGLAPGRHLVAILPGSHRPSDLRSLSQRSARWAPYVFSEVIVITGDETFEVRYRPARLQAFLWRGRLEVGQTP